MQDNGYLSLKEVASLCNCTTQNISQKIKRNISFYREYTYKERNRLYISKDVIDTLKGDNYKAENDKKTIKQESPADLTVDKLAKAIEELKAENKELRAKVEDRQEKIDTLTADYIEMSKELKQLSSTMQPLLAIYGKELAYKDKNILEAKPIKDKPEKQGLLKRLDNFLFH